MGRAHSPDLRQRFARARAIGGTFVAGLRYDEIMAAPRPIPQMLLFPTDAETSFVTPVLRELDRKAP